jgi:hypothetical protein
MNYAKRLTLLGLTLWLSSAPLVRAEDSDGDSLKSEPEVDTDLDGILDSFDPDDDGDGLHTLHEVGSPSDPVDSDGDQLADYLDVDDDGDGVPTAAERPDPNADADPSDAVSTANNQPDYLNDDDDDDGILTKVERPDGLSVDTDLDGKPNYLDDDDDQDGLYHESSSDRDADGLPDYLDGDDDGDGVPSERENRTELDFDGDGQVDALDDDDDGDGLLTRAELGSLESPRDSDADGQPDYLDGDDDGDGIPTRDERTEPLDRDGDGKADYLDDDDDGDGIPTRAERALAPDQDGDGALNWHDLDADGDGASDAQEGVGDLDGDGIPNFLDRLNAAGDAGGATDAGATRDAALPPTDDASSRLGVAPRRDEGCALGGAPAGSSLPTLLLGLLALVLRKRRRQSARSGAPRSAVLLLLLTVVGAPGCGEEPRGSVALDAGPRPEDAAQRDARKVDGAPDDAAEPVLADAGDAAQASSECVVEGDPIALPVEESIERAWTAVLDGDVVHLAYAVTTCGAVGSASGTRLDYRTMRSVGALSEATVLTPDLDGACRLVRSPALAAHGGVMSAYYTSNGEGSFELYERDVALARPALRRSEDAVGAENSELLTEAYGFGDTPLLTYVNQSSPGAATQLVSARPGLGETEIVGLGLAQRHVRLALGAAPSAALGGLLAWVSERTGAFAIELQPLSIAGAPQGARATLSNAVGGLSDVALAARAGHAAVVYVVQTGSIAELRYREIDAAGRPSPREVKLTTANRSVSSSAIAAYANGYVVAFRELPLRSDMPGAMRLSFITKEGAIGGERRISDAARGSGAARVFVMNDGRLIVLWSDSEASGTMLRGLRLRCL